MRRVGKDFSRRITPLFPTMVVQNQQEQGEGSIIATNPQHAPTITQPSTFKPKKTQKPKKPKKKNTEVSQPSGSTDNVADEAVNEETNDSLVKAATTASSLEAEQDSGDIIKTQSKATPNEASSQGTSSGGGPRCQETLGDTIAQTSMKLMELMEICAKLQQRVLDLETTKSTQANKIESLKRRVKKLKRRNKSRTHGLKRLYKVGSSRRVKSPDKEDLGEADATKQGRIADIDADAGLPWKEKTKMVSAAEETVNVAATIVSTASKIPSEKPKADKVVIQEPEQGTTTITPTTQPIAKGIAFRETGKSTTTTISSKDKGKGIMVEEPAKMKKKDQISFDEQVAQRLQAQMQAELEEEER
ncbi:hypothetical protein Tco_1274726 [Tanacetum coccineum]